MIQLNLDHQVLQAYLSILSHPLCLDPLLGLEDPLVQFRLGLRVAHQGLEVLKFQGYQVDQLYLGAHQALTDLVRPWFLLDLVVLQSR